jgi:alkaline phosphatase D
MRRRPVKNKYFLLYLMLGIFLFITCTNKSIKNYQSNFNSTNDRTWIGQDYWAVPMEDWKVNNGRIECYGNRQNMRVNLLTYVLGEEKTDFSITVKLGELNKGDVVAAVGLRIGIFDKEDLSAKSACYFGKGLDAVITTDNKLILGDKQTAIPSNFNFSDITISFKAVFKDGYNLELTATDVSGMIVKITNSVKEIRGLVAMVNLLESQVNSDRAPHFWFDDISLTGPKVTHQPKNSFGPILWSMYTLSRNTLKLSAQMPPLGEKDNQTIQMELKQKSGWNKVGTTKIETDSRTALFKLEDWDSTKDVPYRLVYSEKDKDGQMADNYYEGIIQRDPVDKPLALGALTCQHGSGFPYTPVVNNLTTHNPDMLYFSGDQIYEGNGGYGIIRFPADRAIISYLGKWYMFGWAFGDLMRDRPTVCTPDDHDVFQGNLWGDGGRPISEQRWTRYKGGTGGYFQPAQMVNAVHQTQCAHLPDPFDSTPLQQNIRPFYTDLVYGRISFAIITDRGFKSGPSEVAFWPGRPDHVKQALPDMSVLNRPDLTMLGDRQLVFLNQWITGWRGADMKVVLGQTVLANITTHHGGNKMELLADLDAGGWPKPARDEAVKIFRKGFAFHISGDQHIPSLSQYGVKNYRDSGWSFCTPAIYVGYERRFFPEKTGQTITNPPNHGLPHTGHYKDPLGNFQYVYAIGNPVDNPAKSPRWQRGQDKASGYGLVHFDQIKRTIKMEAFKYLANLEANSQDNQFQGWPLTINQLDNYGRKSDNFLPKIKVANLDNPVIFVTNESSGELEYAVRIKGNFWVPKVFSDEKFSIKIGDPDLDIWKEINNLTTANLTDSVTIQF